jgi:dTDP-4-amino-4,6-dideoxygalactose transaminase
LSKPDMLSTSVMLTRGLLSLPIYPELTDSEVEYIAEQVKNFYNTIC